MVMNVLFNFRNSFPVYNCACGEDRKVTIEQMLEIGIHGVSKGH